MGTITETRSPGPLELLDTFINLEKLPPRPGFDGLGTENMAELLRRLGQPQAGIPAVHIAGTKGKGSTASMAAALLAAAGLKVGLYTSPHVNHLRERIMLNGRPVSEEAFAAALEEALAPAEAMRSEGRAPSYFEVLTAAAFLAFHTAGVEAMVLETGLGGRLDATNISDLDVAAAGLTPISMDHEDILGHTLKEIAAEKAGILRRGVPILSAEQEAGVAKLIADRAERLSSRLLLVGRDVSARRGPPPPPDHPELPQTIDLAAWRANYKEVPLPYLGGHQADNAAMALGLAELLLERMGRQPLARQAIETAWRGLNLPGRMEVLASHPWRIVDGAHNPASAWAAAEVLEERFSRGDRTMVFGVAGDKDWRTMLKILAPLVDRVVFTSFASPRAENPAALRDWMRERFPEKPCSTAADVTDALKQARKAAQSTGLILVTGSMWLAGEARAKLLSRTGGSHRRKA